jgi:hypothetical protein
MKQFLFVVLASLQIVFLILSCEEIVDIDPPAEEPRLVVDGLVRVDPLAPLPPPLRLGIKVSETSAFLGEVPATDLKQITMSGLVLQDSANPGSGFYENLFTARALRQGGDNLLQIQHKDQRYLARGFYMHSAPIDTVYQGDGNSFNDNTEIVIQFKDSINRQNFYLIDFDNGQYMTSSDKLYDGKTQTISFIYDREIPSGTEITVSLMGIDRSFYNYMNKLIEQSKEEIDLFQTPVSTLRGNIINVTEIDNIDFFDNVDQFNNFALGYYAVAETFTKTLIIE